MPVVSVASRLVGCVTGSVDRVSGGYSPSWKCWARRCPPEIPHFEYEACTGEWALGVGCCSDGVPDAQPGRSRLTQPPSRAPLGGGCGLGKVLRWQLLPGVLGSLVTERSNWYCCTPAGYKYLFRVSLSLVITKGL